MTTKYKRVLLKLSGEALMGGNKALGIDPATVFNIAEQIKRVVDMGTQVAIVVGGGNIFRGSTAEANGMDRATADYAGMLATIINALVLQDSLEKSGVVVRTQSAINVQSVAEPYIRRRAMRHLEKGRVVIFVAGTGNPFFTTDTAAALRAVEMDADVILKATKVDGVYDKDPVKHADAKRFDRLTFTEAMERRLKVMDLTAFSLCMERGIPVIVFNAKAPGHISEVVSGKPHGTRIE